MTFSVEDSISHNSTLKKHIASLKKVVQQTKIAILDKLNKSEKRYKEDIDSSKELEKKTVLQKKLDKITKEQNVLKNLKEDEIVTFALNSQQNLMALAANCRMPLVLRMKARVASHKPLSTHITRIKSKQKVEEESEDEEESENDENSENKDESSKPLDKMCVNNQIVKMRKNVKQAKVYIIHKLTRNITKLRRVKGKNEEKYKKKADRLVKKIQHLKDTSEDEISRFALTSTEDLTKLSSDINVSMNQQVMATVAIHRCVLPAIVEFKNKYPDCNKKVATILKQKKKKRKLNTETTEHTIENNKPLNKKSKLSTLSEDSGESENENQYSEGSEIENDDDDEENQLENGMSDEESGQSISGEQSDDNSEPSDGSEEDSMNEDQSNYNHGKPGLNENSDADDSTQEEIESDERPIKKINSKTNKINNKIIKSNKRLLLSDNTNKSLIEEGNSSSEDNEVSNSSRKSECSKKSEIKKTITKKVVDPFFVTSTNEEYITSQVPTVNEDTQSSWRERNNNFDSRESNKFHNNFRKWDKKEDYKTQRNFNKFDNKPYSRPTFNNFDKGHNNSKFSAATFVVGNRRERRKALLQPLKEEKPEKLHPSWEAKKKISSIASFQGKKITFD